MICPPTISTNLKPLDSLEFTFQNRKYCWERTFKGELGSRAPHVTNINIMLNISRERERVWETQHKSHIPILYHMRAQKHTIFLLSISLLNLPPKLWPGWIMFPVCALKWKHVQYVTSHGTVLSSSNPGQKTLRWLFRYFPFSFRNHNCLWILFLVKIFLTDGN